MIPNLGVAIILLTIFIMLLLFPLTAKQAKSMIAMQKLAPEIKKLQAKYKGDRQKLNEETMKLYQENKVNPLASCLPLLLQLPIFFALFRVLRDSYKHVPQDSSLYKALCGGVSKCTADTAHHLKFLGIDLQKSAVDAHNGFLSAFPYFLLVALVVLTGYLQSRQAQKRTPAANKQMAMVTKVLPVFFGLISLQFPAGLVLYFFVSNLWRLGQQEVIFRRFQSGSAAAAKPAIGKAAPATAKAVIDVDSRDRNGDEPVADAESDAPEVVKPPPPARAPRPEPATRTTASQAGAAPRRGGGLRGLFQPPPPPDGNGTTTSSAKPKPVKPAPSKSVSKGGGPSPRGSSASSTGRPGQAGRRTSNKKRKRKR
ncbi:MAG: membrane protein insertase YidC [Thermoplasmata archaeon]|nr:membrane protein insertase YidC [Thermoplasmata archaeon]